MSAISCNNCTTYYYLKLFYWNYVFIFSLDPKYIILHGEYVLDSKENDASLQKILIKNIIPRPSYQSS